MACSLTPSTTAREDFLAKTGSTVTLTISGPGTAGVELVALRYAGAAVDLQEPYEFTIQSGANFLTVLIEASKPGVLCQLIEVCGTDQQVIDRLHYDPMNPARGYIIRGTA